MRSDRPAPWLPRSGTGRRRAVARMIAQIRTPIAPPPVRLPAGRIIREERLGTMNARTIDADPGRRYGQTDPRDRLPGNAHVRH